MAKLSKDLAAQTLHPRETIYATGVIGAINGEVIIDADGASSVTLDLRGTFNITFEVSGTIDGTNWTLIPMRPIAAVAIQYVAAVSGSTAGLWVGACGHFRRVRVRSTAYTSGSATVTLSACNGILDQTTAGAATPLLVTSVGASGAAVTLTLPGPGTGLRQYMTYLSINRFAAATLTAAAVPVTVTTTNLPGALAFSFGAEGLGQGVLDRWREDFTYPLASSALNTATTIVCPATTNVIWRVTAGYFVAP